MATKPSVLAWSEPYPAGELVAAVQRLEHLGYHELWLPERSGREPFATCGYLLARTTALRVSSGIANVYVRDADAAAQARRTLAELSGGRFSLGLGVSHPALVEPRGHRWEPPVAKMRAYLERIAAAAVESPAPAAPAPVVVAAHGRGLWRVAAELADGVLTNLLVPETVRRAREALGPDKQIHVLVRCVLDADAARARAAVRRAVAFYLGLPAYHRTWAQAGFTEADWRGGGSDRLIDALCARGDADQIRARLTEFEQAGASHIVVVPVRPGAEGSDRAQRWEWSVLEALAPAAWEPTRPPSG